MHALMMMHHRPLTLRKADTTRKENNMNKLITLGECNYEQCWFPVCILQNTESASEHGRHVLEE